jgi:hypothetical protein
MQKFAEKLFQQWIDMENRTDLDEISLIDLVRTYCQTNPHIEFEVNSQMDVIRNNTFRYIGIRHVASTKASMQFIVCDLFQRAVIHDNSKFSPEEYEPYEQAFPGLQKYAYGTEEFKAELRKIKPAIQHHYENNSHHPEYNADGINGMSLLDVIEMTCDWIAASERSQKDIFTGLEMNKERFKISDQLHGIIKNTVIALKEEK